MAVSTSFATVFSIFQFASFAKNLKGEDDEELFVLVSALRSANVFPCALLDVDLTEKKRLVVFAQTNVISFDQARALFF